MYKIIIAVFLLNYSIYSNCGGCARGESILSRATERIDVKRVSLDNLYTYKIVPEPFLVIPTGTPIEFNAPVLVQGTGITEISPNTFLITKTGHYLSTFVIETLSIGASEELLGGPANAGVEYLLNGVSQGVMMNNDPPLVLNQILNVTTVPTTLQVVTTGIDSLSVDGGTSATLSIVRISSSD